MSVLGYFFMVPIWAFMDLAVWGVPDPKNGRPVLDISLGFMLRLKTQGEVPMSWRPEW